MSMNGHVPSSVPFIVLSVNVFRLLHIFNTLFYVKNYGHVKKTDQPESPTDEEGMIDIEYFHFAIITGKKRKVNESRQESLVTKRIYTDGPV